MGLEMNAERAGYVLQMCLSGELTRDETAAFRSWAENQMGDQGDQIEIDCSALTYIDSAGLGSLIYLRKRVHEGNGTLQLTNISGWLQKFLEVTGLAETFTNLDTEPA